jgi:hypothetical protein
MTTTDIEAKTAPQSFRERFIRLYECRPEHYERRVLELCVHSKHAVLARLFFKIDKENFKTDLQLIRLLGAVTQYSEFKTELDAWRSSHPSKGYLRKKLRLRVSGKNLLRLASRIFRGPNDFGFDRRGWPK